MKLDMIQKGQSVMVSSINTRPELKNRFNSFGLVKGAIISVVEHSLTKQTMEVRVNNTRLALRFSEAKEIEVQHD